MTLFRGDREIRLLYLGHGHTGGDLVVYLPKEKVLCTGDLLVHDVANLIDGYVNEWPDALEKLRPLDFVDVIPGPRRSVQGQGADRLVPGLPARPLEAGDRAARPEGARGRRGEAHRHDRAQGALPGDYRVQASIRRGWRGMFEVMEGRADAVASSLHEVRYGYHNHNARLSSCGSSVPWRSTR